MEAKWMRGKVKDSTVLRVASYPVIGPIDRLGDVLPVR